MKKYLFYYLFLLPLLGLGGCYGKFTQAIPEQWEALTLETEYPIDNIHIGLGNILIASPGEFIRIDRNHNIIEWRELSIGERVYGHPMFSEDVLVRVVRPPQSQNKQILEFHLTRSAEDVLTFSSDKIAKDVAENLSIESNARNTGAFNDSGSQYLLPAISALQSSYSFFLFDIELNGAKDRFASVNMVRRINIKEIPPDADAIINMKYINGAYYVTSLEGAYRIDPATGGYVQLFDDWFLDVFSHQGKLYMTGLSADNFFFSVDNGVSWQPVPLQEPTQLTQVEVVNGQVLSQQHSFDLFFMADENLQQVYPIVWNSDFRRDFTNNYSMVYFNDRYYLTVSKNLYFSPELFVEQ